MKILKFEAIVSLKPIIHLPSLMYHGLFCKKMSKYTSEEKVKRKEDIEKINK